MIDISSPIRLPCGVRLPNRLCKSALTEGLSDEHNRTTARHHQIYERWSRGGCGLLFTGNVQVDRRYLERAGNIALDGNGGLDQLTRLAEVGATAGNGLWMQIGHAGRQVFNWLNPEPAGPSAIALNLGDAFGTPRALSEEEILNVIQRFTQAALTAKETGFGGVQAHSAHGYLLSSFLSPRANQRSDRWGGALKNRARLLLESVRAMRRTVGPNYPLSIKLNSSDFQQDGFSDEECLEVVDWLNQEGLDLLELSGGNYESPALMGRESTAAREAYFLEYAEKVKAVAKMPVMVTGGFRSVKAMNKALQSGSCDLIGLGRPLVTQPEIANLLLADPNTVAEDWENHLRPRSAAIHWYYMQIFRLADGLDPDVSLNPEEAQKQRLGNEFELAGSLAGRNL